ncbi:MAG: hybrid sensor histidine kinase/response regulator, partial [Nevskia sp.]|nr:hybrid sensor histidine kinase/response regulator [Nevskia sp.]
MSGPRPRSAFEIANGLHWVRGEIETSLTRTRAAIEQYLEGGGDGGNDPQPLHTAADELRLVRGSLAMIECFGAGMLAQEMVLLLEALIAGKAEHADEAYAALSGATLQLSDYVDLLAHGAADRVLVLQPVVNELRLAGGRPLSTEAELFAQQLRVQAAPVSTDASGNSAAAQALAKRELVALQTAFLHWFRGQHIDAALERIGKIADSVAVNAAAAALREFWSGCAALTECLLQQNQDSLDLKRLFGRAVSQLKLLAEGGEPAALAQLGDAPQQVLFHIAHTPHPSPRAAALIAGLRLDVLLPSLPQITDLRRRLRGPNTTILNRVYAEIRRDFTQLKDAIDLAVRTRGRTSADLGATRERLRRMAQTVGALGLPAAQAALLNQAVTVAELPPGAPQWVDTATAILRVEHSLEEALFRALGRAGEAASRDYAEIAAEIPHGQDLRESIAALVRECLVEFAQLKNAVDTYLKAGEPTALLQAPQRLHDISAALKMLGQQRASDILGDLQRYVAEGRLAASKNEPGGFERFADAVSCAEVFFEALRDGLPSPERVLDDVAAYVERLRETEQDMEITPPVTAVPLVVEVDLRPTFEPAIETNELPMAPPPAPVSAPVGQGIDPEIRDIFIEEAGEVLLELQQRLPQLKRDPANREVLADVRRAFHTLKGSGRMAGALRIGEFGWAVEDLLNRCLNGALALRPPVLELLDDATKLLPRLVENFRSGGSDDADTAGV